MARFAPLMVIQSSKLRDGSCGILAGVIVSICVQTWRPSIQVVTEGEQSKTGLADDGMDTLTDMVRPCAGARTER